MASIFIRTNLVSNERIWKNLLRDCQQVLKH